MRPQDNDSKEVYGVKHLQALLSPGNLWERAGHVMGWAWRRRGCDGNHKWKKAEFPNELGVEMTLCSLSTVPTSPPSPGDPGQAPEYSG